MAGPEVTGDPPDRGHADPRLAVDLAVRDFPLQQPDDRPAIRQRLQLGGGAQVAEEIAALLDAAQREDRLEQRALGGGFLARGQAAVGLPGALPV